MLSLTGALACLCLAADEPAKSAEKDVVWALTLWQDYGSNELGADEKYKDKTITISGPVHSVGKATNGRYFVGLYIVDPETAEGVKYPPNIVCLIDDKSRKDFAGLKTGQRIKVVGKVVGRKNARVYEGYVVTLEECRLLK